jgi:3-oxoacyl-[acyl-carrier protein] reductase
MLQGRLAHSANLEGQVALVTGASRGIGQAIALALGEAGATVVGTATSDKGAQAISDYLATASRRRHELNVTDRGRASIGDTPEWHPPANAGITCDNLLMRMKDEEWYDIRNQPHSQVPRVVLSKRNDEGACWRIINDGGRDKRRAYSGQGRIMATSPSLAREVGSQTSPVTAWPGFIARGQSDA